MNLQKKVPNNYRMLFGLILLLLLSLLFIVIALGKAIPSANQNLITPLIIVLASALDRFAQWAFHVEKDPEASGKKDVGKV